VPVLIAKSSLMGEEFDGDELKGKKIIAQRGTPYSDMLREWAQKYGARNLTTKAATEKLVDDVKRGEADAVLTSYPVALCATYKANDSQEQCIYTIDNSTLDKEFNSTNTGTKCGFAKRKSI